MIRKPEKCPKCKRHLVKKGWMWYCKFCKKYYTRGYDGKLHTTVYRRSMV